MQSVPVAQDVLQVLPSAHTRPPGHAVGAGAGHVVAAPSHFAATVSELPTQASAPQVVPLGRV